MPTPKHRREAQKALDKIWGVKAKDAKLAQAFGYNPKTSKKTVRQFVITKGRTRKKKETIKRILSPVGLETLSLNRIDAQTAKRLVARAKKKFGPRPKLVNLQTAITTLQIGNSQIRAMAKNKILSRLKLKCGPARETIYFDRKTLARELKSKKVETFLMRQVRGKNKSVIQMRRQLVEKLQQNADRLLKQ